MTLIKIASWNVNGMRSVFKKNFENSIQSFDPHILCLQEIRSRIEDIPLDHLNNFTSNYDIQAWNSSAKKGYSGTSISVKKNDCEVSEILGFPPKSIIYGIGNLDDEGRVISIEYNPFILINIYSPNSRRGLVRLNERINWENDLRNHIKSLQAVKPVIICGDFNVAHRPIDLSHPKRNENNPGYFIEERNCFSLLLSELNCIDSFRYINGDSPNVYSWWSNMGRARERNVGWRIDYFCVDKRLEKNLKNSFVFSNIMGSDHCPVGIELEF